MNQLELFTWENLMIWATGFVFLSLMIERALFQVFQTKAYGHLEEYLDSRGDYFDLKPWISKAVSIAIAISLDLDLPAFLFNQQPEVWRMLMTGLFLSGGSTAIFWILRRGREVKQAAHDVKIKAINGGQNPLVKEGPAK